jgi:uncharacterized GH25 family protein
MIKKTLIIATVLALCSVGLAHDMWLESESFIMSPGQKVIVRNGNGIIYQKSENAVTTDRLSGLIGLDPKGREFEPGPASVEGNWLNLEFTSKEKGNYWIGLGTKARKIRLSGEDFTAYLEHDGIPGIIKERKEKGITDRTEIEQYSKYVKIYLQVGDKTSSNYDKPLGLKIEINPLVNPYTLKSGDSLPVQVLYEGKPLQDLTLHAGHEGQEKETIEATTDAAGKARITINSPGKWYVRGIHLSQVDKEDHSYESYWATTTFQVK